LQGYFVDLQQFLTALLNDVPTLSLTQLNIEKLDEEENASITCELIFQLNKDK
jgi:raw score 6.10